MTKFSEWILNPGTAGPSIVEGMRRLGIPRPQSTEAQARAGTDTTTDMSPLRVTQNVNVRTYSIEAFRSAGASDRAALQAYMDTADETAAVALTAGQVYTFDGTVSAANRAVTMFANNATIRLAASAADQNLLSLTYAYTDATALTAYGTTSINFGGGNTLCQRLTVATGSAILSSLSAGDVVKVVSDQLIPSSVPGDLERMGDMAYVAAVNAGAGTIDLFGLLNEGFVLSGNNLRVARATARNVLISGLRVTIEPSANGRSSPMIYIQGAVKPRILGFTAFSARGPGLELQSAFSADVDAYASDLLTDDGVNEFGYGVVSYAGVSGRYNVMADRVRHAWTEGARSVATTNSPDIHRYGGSIREDVTIIARDCYGPGADTHPSALGTRLRGFVYNAVPGDNTSNTCVQVRGRGEDVDLTTVGLRAVRVSMTGTGGGQTIRVNHTRPVAYGSTLGIATISGDASNPGGAVNLDLACTATGDTFAGIEVSDGAAVTCAVRKFTHACSDVGSIRPRLFDISTGASVSCDQFRLDYAERTGTLNPAVVRCDGTSSYNLAGGRVTIGAGTWFLADMRSGAGVGLIALDSDIASSNIANAGSSSVSPNVSVAGANTRDTVNVRTSANATFTAISTLPRNYYLNEAIASARTVTEVTSGFLDGDELSFTRGPLATGAFNWVIGSDTLASENTWLTRKLVSGSWITVAKGTL